MGMVPDNINLQFFPEDINIDNFPNRTELNIKLYDYNVKRLLNRIKNDIIISTNNNITNTLIHNNTLLQFNNNIIDNVKALLIDLDYRITDVEDINNNIIAWRISWSCL